MHLLFIALLVFGVNWQHKVEPQANIVDLWTSLPPQVQPKIETRPEPPPPQPVAPPKVEAPAPKAAAKAEVAKPDIAIKEKAEKERRALERAEAKKREDEAREAQKLQQAKEADAQRLANEQADAQRKVAEQAAAARQSQIDKYKKAISDKIRRFLVLPPNLQGNPEAEFNVVVLPDGNILGGSTLRRSSGNPAYDSAVERAIARAQPLPLPPDPALFREFRELNLRFKPQE
jgi:colicin import membrane protein